MMMTVRIITNSMFFSELIEHRGGVSLLRRILPNRKFRPRVFFSSTNGIDVAIKS